MRSSAVLKDKRRPPALRVASLCMTAFYAYAIYLMLLVFVDKVSSAPTEDVQITDPVIGIDFGTSYSCVAVVESGRVEIIVNGDGDRTTPSWVAWTDEEMLIGKKAKDQYLLNNDRIVFYIKRMIGRNFSDRDFHEDAKYLPFEIVHENDQLRVQVDFGGDKKTFTPEELSAAILGKVKEVAESYLNKVVRTAVIAVPAYFDDVQRATIKEAGAAAGLDVVRVLNEPIAAALAYGLDKKSTERLILVYDLGSSTFDASILTVDHGVFEVYTATHETYLGGDNFDQRVVDYVVRLYDETHHLNITQDAVAMRKLKYEAEKAKWALSNFESTSIEIEAFYLGEDFSQNLSRAKFEDLNIDLFQRTLHLVEQMLENAKLEKSDIDDIVLIGGSTRIPKVQDMFEALFGKRASKEVPPDEAVAYGAAILGDTLSGDATWMDDCFPDFNLFALGVETAGGVMTDLIKRSSLVPEKKSRVFSTIADNQTVVLIQIFEGNQPMTKDNNLLGAFELTGVPLAPSGQPEIEITFELDANDIISVTAVDKATGKSEGITILGDSRISMDEAKRMLHEVERYAAKDKASGDRIRAHMDLESFAISLQNQSKDEKDPTDGTNTVNNENFLYAPQEPQVCFKQDAVTAAAKNVGQAKQRFGDVASAIKRKIFGTSVSTDGIVD